MSTRSYFLGALVVAAVLGHTLEAPGVNRVYQRDGLIRYPIVARQKTSAGDKYKRQIDTDALAQEEGNVYTIDLTIGTPGQTVPVQVDTGSSLLWVNPTCDTTLDPTFCNVQPRLTESSTQTDLGKADAQYKYVSDYVSIGSARISQQVFGIANATTSLEVGVLGVAPSRDGWDAGYPTVIDSLAKQGLTNSRAFSVSLKGYENTEGSIIFGGIDTGKYEGSLTKLPIIPASQSPDNTTRFWVSLDSITVTQADGTSVSAFSSSEGGKAQAAALDTGNDLIAVPSSIAQKFAAGFPSAKYDSTAYVYTIDCNDPGQGQTVDFTFGDVVIKIPFADFILRNPVDSSLCYLGILGQGDVDQIDIGQPFFRAAFAVFDWDNQNVHLAQSADCGSNLVAIGKGADAVPSLTGDCGKPAPTSSTLSSAASSTSSSSAAPTSRSTSSSATPTPTASTSSATLTSSASDSSATATSAATSSSASSASSSGPASTAAPTSSASSSSSSTDSTSQASDTAGLPSKADTNATGGPTASSSATSAATYSATASTTATSAFSASPSSAATTTYTYTYTTTRTSTITSCPVTVTDCPVGAVVYTTDVVTATTEVCPESATATATATAPAMGSATATIAATSSAVPQKTWTTSVATATTMAVTKSVGTAGVAPVETETETECTAETAAATVTTAPAAAGSESGTGTGAGAAGASNGAGNGNGNGGGAAGTGSAVSGNGSGGAGAGPPTTLVWSAGSSSGSSSRSGAAAGTGAPYVSSSVTTPTQSVVYAGAGRVGPGWVLAAVMGVVWAVVGLGM